MTVIQHSRSGGILSMSIRHLDIPDASGRTLHFVEYEGRRYPDFPPESIKCVATLKARPNDVVVCAYPKSGTHWVWEMVRLLLAGTTDLPPTEKDDGMIEHMGPEKLEVQPSPRILNTHFAFDTLSDDMLAKRNKIIYVTRDPRDTAVSYFHHHKKLTFYYRYDGDWKDYFPLFLEGQLDYGCWFAYTKGFEEAMKKDPTYPFFVTSYEKLHLDTIGELRRLASFLGVKPDNQFLEEVRKKCDFETMRNTKGANEDFGHSGSPVMYRKGKVGDWKNVFTMAQAEKFDSVFEQEMRGTQAYELYSRTRCSSRRQDSNMNET